MKEHPPVPARSTRYEWLPTVPKHWDVNRIRYTTYVKGRIGWQGLRSDEFVDAGPYLVTGTDFRDGQIDWSNCYHISEQRFHEDPYIHLREGDLLITKDGTIGKVAVVTEMRGPASLNSGVFVTRPLASDYITRFMYWVLCSQVFSEFIEVRKTGTTISHLYQNVFDDFAYPLPPIEEQIAIAAFLDRETARIDRLIEQKAMLSENLKKRLDAFVFHAVTGSLGNADKRKPSGLELCPLVPADWKAERLKWWVSLFSGFAFTGEHFRKSEDEWPVLVTPGNFHPDGGLYFDSGNRTVYDSAEVPKDYTLRPRDLVVVMTDLSYKRLILSRAEFVPEGEYLLNQRIARVDVHPGKRHELLPEYLRLGINTVVREQVLPTTNGATVFHTSAAKILNCVVFIPPYEEQHRIVDSVNTEHHRMQGLRDDIASAIRNLTEYRSALITAAVSGQLDVCNYRVHEAASCP